MAVRIMNTDERQPEARGIKVLITAKNGIGKANILAASPLPSKLFLDREKPDQGGET